jgi:intracellular sulfur oxidation DsrE/DsrF family protein
MENNDLKSRTNRRHFLGSLASGAAALGIATVTPTLNLHANSNIPVINPDDPDAWFNQIKGKHRMIFDATGPHEIFPFAWPKVFLLTNAATGTPEKDCSVVVVLRHSAIPFAFEDRLWKKYNFNKVFKIDSIGPSFQAVDAADALANRNPFWKPKEGDFKLPGMGAVPIGINDLQANGVMFCVCSAAIGVYTNVVAGMMKMDPAEVMKDWMAGLLPGVQAVPSGVWAVGRAQEHGCQYCFVG